MERRAFLASLLAIPAGVALAVKAKAVVVPTPPPDFVAYRADSRGIHQLLQDCGNVVEKPLDYLDLDEVFQRVYELRESPWVQSKRTVFYPYIPDLHP